MGGALQWVSPCWVHGTPPGCFQPGVVAPQPPDLGLLGHEVLPAGSAQGLQVLVLGPSATARLERVGACAEPWLCLRQEGVIRTGTHTPIGLLVC